MFYDDAPAEIWIVCIRVVRIALSTTTDIAKQKLSFVLTQKYKPSVSSFNVYFNNNKNKKQQWIYANKKKYKNQ